MPEAKTNTPPLPFSLLIHLAFNSNLSVFPIYPDDIMGQLFSLLVLMVEAAESVIGSAIQLFTLNQ